MACEGQCRAVGNRLCPGVCGRRAHRLLPHEPGHVVGDRAIPVVREALRIRRASSHVYLTIGHRPLSPIFQARDCALVLTGHPGTTAAAQTRTRTAATCATCGNIRLSARGVSNPSITTAATSAPARTQTDAEMGSAGQARVARIIPVTQTSLGSHWAATSAVCARSTTGATDTTVGQEEVVAGIHLAQLGTGFRAGADLPRGAIDIRLALLAALLIHGANQPRRAIAVVDASGGRLTHRRLSAGGDAALPRLAVGRCMAGDVALAPGAHQALVAIAIEYARAARIYLLRRTATCHQRC